MLLLFYNTSLLFTRSFMGQRETLGQKVYVHSQNVVNTILYKKPLLDYPSGRTFEQKTRHFGRYFGSFLHEIILLGMFIRNMQSF